MEGPAEAPSCGPPPPPQQTSASDEMDVSRLPERAVGVGVGDGADGGPKRQQMDVANRKIKMLMLSKSAEEFDKPMTGGVRRSILLV